MATLDRDFRPDCVPEKSSKDDDDDEQNNLRPRPLFLIP